MYYNDWLPPPVPEDVFQQICADMETAEQSERLDKMFQGGMPGQPGSSK